MLERVYLGGKYWGHNGECSTVAMPAHVHYGENVILSLDSADVPERVSDEYLIIFGDPTKEPPRGLINGAN